MPAPHDARPQDVTSVYICPWSLKDPLCQTQSLAYLKGLTEERHRFALITFEFARYALPRAERLAAARELREVGIYWYPVPYNALTPALRKTLMLVNSVAIGTYVVVKHRPRIVHTRSTVPTGIGILLARLFRLALLYDTDEERSRELLEQRHWSTRSPTYRLLLRCERIAHKLSESTVVLTRSRRDRLLSETSNSAPVTVIPCCVDTERFRFDPEKRAARRHQLGITDERLFVYMGKIGGHYLVDETFELFRVARERMASARLLILSPDRPEAFDAIAERHGVPSAAYDVRRVPHAEVVEWLAAADVGMDLMAARESKLGASPVKVGEYLAVGLPVIITKGLGDYAALIEVERLGAVVRAHTSASYEVAIDEVTTMWREGDGLRARCRNAAETNVSLQAVGVPRYRDVYRQLATRAEGKHRR